MTSTSTELEPARERDHDDLIREYAADLDAAGVTE